MKPNMTSHTQPLDNGIIRTSKAHYRRELCTRAIELDEADGRDIYKINILEAMTMICNAWKSVESSTIRHCWDHAEIQLA
jgi:DDE superfamily endonuclease